MPDTEPHPPEESLRPEYPGGDTKPLARRYDRTEPWLTVVAGMISEYGYQNEFATGRRYDTPSMMQAFLYHYIADTGSFHRLESHLKANPKIAHAFGFTETVPAGDTFREWWKNRLNERQRDVLEDVAENILGPRIGRELVELGLPEGKHLLHTPTPPSDTGPAEITSAQKNEAINHIRPLAFDQLDFERAENVSYDSNHLLDLQAEVSREQDYIQQTVESRGDEEMWPRTFFDAVDNRAAENWEDEFREVYDREIQAAKGAGMLDRPVPVFIDATIRPFFKQNAGLAEGVRGGEPKNGTYYGYHHVTISAHADGRSILLATFQFTPDDTLQDAVKHLVREAENHVSIKEIAMDSAFRKAEMLQWLDERGHKFTVQIPRHGERIKLALARMDGRFDYTEDYYVQSSDKKTRLDDLTLVAEPNYDNVDGDFDFSLNADTGQHGLGEFGGGLDVESTSLEDLDDRRWKGRRAYLTNKDIGSKDDAKRAIKRYNLRWTIETKYRVIKNEFLGKTTSRKFAVRTFFWLFACLLYNAWVLLDVFLRGDHPDLAPEDRPVMPARSFARQFFRVDYG